MQLLPVPHEATSLYQKLARFWIAEVSSGDGIRSNQSTDMRHVKPDATVEKKGIFECEQHPRRPPPARHALLPPGVLAYTTGRPGDATACVTYHKPPISRGDNKNKSVGGGGWSTRQSERVETSTVHGASCRCRGPVPCFRDKWNQK